MIIFGITKRPVRLSAQERATLRINASNRAELRERQYDIRTRVQGTEVTYHYLRTDQGLRGTSYTVH